VSNGFCESGDVSMDFEANDAESKDVSMDIQALDEPTDLSHLIFGAMDVDELDAGSAILQLAV